MTRVLHILPEDGIGGAEAAASQAVDRQGDAMRSLFLIGGDRPNRRAPYSPLAACSVAMEARRWADVAVFSLWKTSLALLATRLLAPRVKIVLFLHSDRAVHRVDHVLTRLGAWLADEVWADSPSSVAGRLPARSQARARVISFVQHRPEGRIRDRAAPRFIYWGRLNPLKRIDRALRLFARLADGRPEARLLLIGPDAGTRASLETLAADLGIADQVAFAGPKTFAEITTLAADHDIYLQLSEQEGAAGSVIEAMQLGLVPVVTPVGQMAVYCRPFETGLIYETEDQAVADIERLLADPALFARLSAAAIDHWAKAPLYDEDFMDAAGALAARED